MNLTRRTFLRAGLTGGTVTVALAAGLPSPGSVLAAWPASAFQAQSVEDALKALGEANTTESPAITVQAPDIAENGAVVSVTVSTTLPQVESISVLAKDNTSPLTASYLLADATEGYVSSRIKMRKTSDVIAVVRAGGKVYTAKKSVKVTLGGCGG